MGKYMRKGKVSGEVAVMEVPGGAVLGVRTRSRTLALQRAQRPPDKGEAGEAAGEYLELRSRRLEKPHKEQPATAAVPAPKRGAARKAAATSSPALAEDEVEVSLGENVLDFDAMESAEAGQKIMKEPELIAPQNERNDQGSSFKEMIRASKEYEQLPPYMKSLASWEV